MLIGFYILFAVLVGLFAIGRSGGFFLYFLLSIFLTPIVALIILIMATPVVVDTRGMVTAWRSPASFAAASSRCSKSSSRSTPARSSRRVDLGGDVSSISQPPPGSAPGQRHGAAPPPRPQGAARAASSWPTRTCADHGCLDCSCGQLRGDHADPPPPAIYAAHDRPVIALGLASRRYPFLLPAFLGKYPGDALWALMVFCGLAFLFPAARSPHLAAGAWRFPPRRSS